MILNAVLFGHGSHEAAWRAPDARATAPLELAHWLACARAAEAAGFDGLFLGDILCLQDRPEHHPSETVDPFMVLAALAGATERLRLTGTASTSFNHPWHLARRILSLHHLSGGRAGWNIVTSSYPQEAANFGWDEMPATADRYALAEDVVQAVRALWAQWDGVERVADKASGRYLSRAPDQTAHRGRYGATGGPVNLSPAPHARPLLAQAGSSAEGMAFAARHADHVFTVQSDMASAKAFRAPIRAGAAAAGRDSDAVKVLPGVVAFIAETREKAEAQLQTLTDRIGLDHLLVKLGRFTGLSFDGFDLDRELPFGPDDLQENRFSNSRAHLLLAEARRNRLTLRQLIARFAAGRGHLLLVGTGADVARVLKDWVAEGAADGFNIMPPELPQDIATFGKHVMPHLRGGVG
ncbi:NtaA/DmoA family FMN-dependent monooxygenase [Phaeovulum sp. NW3]|uniref:NtaA/DmoA family FMN-dependent monooxygenase n=1 Tax=Phaeovulum sp. NW3 TaxID=2934933 RepID=UPI002022830F|nr:NtaA/DmoA family FMN-dependent monooxygenase [Phaeovulum sp. NW3]MCL7466377.1 NtaA/DmoA family FMN-dependent monooxygenase [Phaeovulum sp. NW3]